MKEELGKIILKAEEYLSSDVTKEDILLLIEEELKLERYQILLNKYELYEEDEILRKAAMLKDKPLGYILGHQYFYSYSFKVNENVLIPRYETEELVEHVLSFIKKDKSYRILDIGTGTGCIAITLDKELTKANIDHHLVALDISPSALEVAKENAERLSANVEFVLSDVFENLQDQYFDIIVSNPPYINRNNYVQERVKKNEPSLALYADEEGLAIYHKILKDARKYNENITLFFEISPDLTEGLTKLREKYLPHHQHKFIKDINKFVRFMIIYV